MKRKLFLGLVGGMLVTLSILSVNTSIKNSGDISLKNIAVMAQASAEDNSCPNGCSACGSFCHCYIDYYWLKEGN